MQKNKVCTQCMEEKPVVEFYRHHAMGDGHLSKCKECTKRNVAANRNKNIERIRAYDRERAKNPARAKAAYEISNNWRKQDSRRSAAHYAVIKAIRKGELTRLPCENCGRSDAFGHHENYDRKTDVTWLCQPCHKQRHKEMALLGIEP